MAHRPSLSSVVSFPSSDFRHIKRRIAASYESELTEHWFRESRLCAAPAHEEASLNELITNAAKHGRGVITVRLEAQSKGGHVLSVCNDGPTLPPGFDPAASVGLGMKIIPALVEQIGGTLQVSRCAHCQGTQSAVSFT